MSDQPEDQCTTRQTTATEDAYGRGYFGTGEEDTDFSSRKSNSYPARYSALTEEAYCRGYFGKDNGRPDADCYARGDSSSDEDEDNISDDSKNDEYTEDEDPSPAVTSPNPMRSTYYTACVPTLDRASPVESHPSSRKRGRLKTKDEKRTGKAACRPFECNTRKRYDYIRKATAVAFFDALERVRGRKESSLCLASFSVVQRNSKVKGTGGV
jgi:hypothetical protein